MNIYDQYKTREELLDALDSQIVAQRNSDGETTFSLRDSQLQKLRAQVQDALRRRDDAEARREEIEKKLEETTRRRQEVDEQIAQLRAQTESPNDMRDALRRYMEQDAVSRAKIAELEARIKPLKDENDAFRARETTRTIERQLVDAAKKLNCCSTAMRDVKRLAPMFHLNEAGIALTDENKLVAEVLQEELEQSPHWLDRSQGAQASAGLADPIGSQERFERALNGDNFYEVLRNAPRSRAE